MTPVFDLGGHRLTVTDDQYADGRRCFVAEHPDLPGCIAYGDTAEEAMIALKAARTVYEASVRRRQGAPTPRAVPRIEQTGFATNNLQFA